MTERRYPAGPMDLPLHSYQLVVNDDDPDKAAIAQALAAGRLYATIESKATRRHLSLSLKCKARGSRGVVPYAQADAVYIDVPRSEGFEDTVGTLYPPHGRNRSYAGCLWVDKHADDARVWAALRLLGIASGAYEVETDRYRVLLAQRCLRCGRQLRHKDSIERHFGPECAEIVGAPGGYVSTHQAKVRPPAEAPAPPVPQVERDDGAEAHVQTVLTVTAGGDLSSLLERS